MIYDRDATEALAAEGDGQTAVPFNIRGKVVDQRAVV